MKKIIFFFALLFTHTLLHAQDQATNFGNLHAHSGARIAFFGNFVNNGPFTDSSTSIVFKGSSGQSVSGTSAIVFKNLVINNGSTGITLDRDLEVGTSLTLTAGPLTLNSRTLSINNSAATALSRTSGYIVSEQTNNAGKIKWKIGTNTTAHVFPFATASGSYIPFTIQVTAGDIGNVTVSTYPTDTDNTPWPTTPVEVAHLDNDDGEDNSDNVVDRFWQIDKDGASGTATLTFTAAASEIGSITSLVAQRWNSSTGHWDPPIDGQVSSATGATVSGVTDFSPWTLSGNNEILPIELIKFEAEVIGMDVELYWETATEINNDYFTVQRSLDGINFSDLAKIAGAGTTSTKQKYQYIDSKAVIGRSYYRLKQTDYDGTFDYSEVRIADISNKPKMQFTVYPNPVTSNTFKVDFHQNLDQALSLVLYDALGQIVSYDEVKAGQSKYDVLLPAEMPTGVYLLKAFNAHYTSQHKLTIK